MPRSSLPPSEGWQFACGQAHPRSRRILRPPRALCRWGNTPLRRPGSDNGGLGDGIAAALLPQVTPLPTTQIGLRRAGFLVIQQSPGTAQVIHRQRVAPGSCRKRRACMASALAWASGASGLLFLSCYGDFLAATASSRNRLCSRLLGRANRLPGAHEAPSTGTPATTATAAKTPCFAAPVSGIGRACPAARPTLARCSSASRYPWPGHARGSSVASGPSPLPVKT